MASDPTRVRSAGVRIGDVARQAGVSTATVSRALAMPEQVREETRKRVLEAVRALGYTPNAAARHLRGGRSRMILVVVPRRANPPFFSEVLRGIDVELSAAGYSTIMGNLDGEGERERQIVDLMFAGHIDGAIILSGLIPAYENRSMLDAGIPLVSVCAATAGTPSVLTNEGETIVEGLRHLAALGHRDILYLAGPAGNFNAEARWAAIEAFMAGGEASGLVLRPIAGDFMFGGGVAAAGAFLAMAPRPTAILCCSDEMAIGFMKSVQAAGVRVPGDVSVVGFDGIEFADYCEPTLTTIRQPRYDLGATGARRLVAILAGEDEGDVGSIVIASALRIAASTAPPASMRTNGHG